MADTTPGMAEGAKRVNRDTASELPTGFNGPAVRALYRFEMARMRRTLFQSLVSPVLSTALYFVVFGSAIGSRIDAIEGVPYGSFIVPGLIMMALLNQSLSNASFAIFFPKFTGTIYEILSAPVSAFEILLGYVGAAATKSVILGLIILATAAFIVPIRIDHPVWMLVFLIVTAVDVLPARLHHRRLGRQFREAAVRPVADRDPAVVPRRQLLLDRHAAPVLAGVSLLNPVVYLISAFRWSFFGSGDVAIGISVAMILSFLAACLGAVWWIFRTGYRLKQ